MQVQPVEVQLAQARLDTLGSSCFSSSIHHNSLQPAIVCQLHAAVEAAAAPARAAAPTAAVASVALLACSLQGLHYFPAAEAAATAALPVHAAVAAQLPSLGVSGVTLVVVLLPPLYQSQGPG